jgi:hypothetical protein
MTAATRDRLVFASALFAGALGWAWAGGKEAWDRPAYWALVLPLTYVALFGFGYLASRGAWRWPALTFGAQLATMLLLAALHGGGPGSMAPLGAILFAVLATIGLVPAYLGWRCAGGATRRIAARFAAAARRAAFTAQEP